MTVASATSKAGPYSCDGSTTSFPYAFLVTDAADLAVYVTDSAGVETLLTLNSHYTVSGVDNAAGGSIATTTAYAAGNTLTILRDVAVTQETDLTNGGPWLPDVVESAFDKLTMICQQLQEKIGRAVLVGVDQTQTDQSGFLARCAASIAAALSYSTASANSATNSAASATAAAASATNSAASATAAAASAASIVAVPVGFCGYFAVSTPPAGYLERNGAAISRTTYAALFAVIGTLYGAGNGTSTFNLPDARGTFDRAWDNGRGYDSGRAIGSYQADAFQGHKPQFGGTGTANGSSMSGSSGSYQMPWNASAGSAQLSQWSWVSDGANGTPRTAAETRPQNIAYLAVIKY